MKKRINLLLIFLFAGINILYPQENDWENPRVFGINKLPGRATSVSYASPDIALAADASDSDRVLSLNGLWKFHFSENPSRAPQKFWETDLVQMGVGGNDSWSDASAPLPQYQVTPEAMSYIFSIKPCMGKEAEPSRLGRLRIR